MYSWDLLQSFLQSIFPSNYSYIIQCITKLPSYRTFEIDQFKIDAFVNVITAEIAELMSQVHKQVRQAGEIFYVDASALKYVDNAFVH